MQESCVAFLVEEFLENFHGEKILVDGLACVGENASILKLVVSHFIMSSFEWDAYLKEFSLDLLQHGLYFARYFSKVVVRELLVLGPNPPYKSPAGKNQIWPFVVGWFGNHEELLLESQGEKDVFGVFA